MKPTPFLLRKCSMMKCERQAHYTLDDGRVICDKHAFYWGTATKVMQKVEAEAHKKLPNFEESQGIQGSSDDDPTRQWIKLPWNHGAEDVK